MDLAGAIMQTGRRAKHKSWIQNDETVQRLRAKLRMDESPAGQPVPDGNLEAFRFIKNTSSRGHGKAAGLRSEAKAHKDCNSLAL
jgi:hypothetical protein